MKLNAKQLRASDPKKSDTAKVKRREIYVICDNILDAFNIGSIFRLADAVGASKVFLCGQTQTPPYHRITKAAVGTDKWVSWEHASTAAEAIENLKRKFSIARSERHSGAKQSGAIESRSYQSPRSLQDDSTRLKVIAIEQGKNSVDFRKVDYSLPIAFVIGHETTGVSKDALKLVDTAVEIPMFGVNRSLNVVISLAMVLTKVIEKF